MDVPGQTTQRTGQIVFTNKARCRDCYRCLRACPVKAIRVLDSQAFVDPERCISCGTCIRECPQGAKSFRNDVDRVARLLQEGHPVGVSVAPSFAAYFGLERSRRLPEALHRLGFAYAGETSIGAYPVALATAEHANRSGAGASICTACPAVVNYVEQYEPDLAPRLVPVVSPMLAHAKSIRARLGATCRVVFVGPCVAKKAEAERPEFEGLVDCVLTFAELLEWFARANIDLDACEPGPFDEEPAGESRYFPLPGGLARTASLQTDLLATDCLAVSGFAELRQALDSVRNATHPVLLEGLFCPQGCVNGPGMPEQSNAYVRRAGLLDYASTHAGRVPDPWRGGGDLRADYTARGETVPEFSEADIQAVFERTGKSNPEDQLNCGACGYESCREKALAVLRGMAVPEMCIPRMRRLAEQRSDRIMDTTPNGVVVLDQHLQVLYMNGAFRRMFQCTDGVLGKRISYLMDPEPFEKLVNSGGGANEFTARHEKYSLVCHQIVYAMREEGQFVGIFVNVTNTLSTQEKLKRLRSETLRKAQELIEHQIQASQEMAQFLGETTARTEELVRNIQSMASEKPRQSGDHLQWDSEVGK
jgi:iron only hydrogenase large subunit-like protein/uncharacterized Fe-S cluster-containing protein